MATRTYQPLQMHRIPCTDLTESQVAQALRPAASGPASKSSLASIALLVDHLRSIQH